jgi:TIR domain
MGIHLKSFIRRAKEYVELEARTKVISVKFVERFTLLGRREVVVLAHTTDKDHPDWWVVGGDTPMNLYTRKVFRTADEAFSMHTGLMMRMMAKDFTASRSPPKDVGYDAFISHASEDKVSIARPLARELGRLGFSVWFDEFSLKIGDSLRKDIDRGLRLSRFGIIILSKSFFAKNWPQYELNGLVSREIEGHKVILPVWHKVTKKEVEHFSAPLSDKVAATTANASIRKIARALADAMTHEQDA